MNQGQTHHITKDETMSNKNSNNNNANTTNNNTEGRSSCIRLNSSSTYYNRMSTMPSMRFVQAVDKRRNTGQDNFDDCTQMFDDLLDVLDEVDLILGDEDYNTAPNNISQ